MNRPHPPECCVDDVPESELMTSQHIAEVAKGLAHPTRIRILEHFIERRHHIAQDIVDEIDLAQSTISEHLRILREAGLLEATRDGSRTLLCMRRTVLRQFADAVVGLADAARLGESE